MRTILHFVTPTGIDDPARVSGGNVYDRRVRDGLAHLGWHVRMTQVEPEADDAVRQALARVPDDGLVLVDGLIAGGSAAALEREGSRLRLVVLAHMVSDAFPDADPGAVEGERRALRAARRVIATSEWTRAELAAHGIRARVVVAVPGADHADVSDGTPDGVALLCVGVVAPHKGQDVLIDALARLAEVEAWHCTLVGDLDTEAAFAADLRDRSREAGVAHRIDFAGVKTAAELDRVYARTDVLVAPSRVEAYGIAIAEARRRGIPVIASTAGGIREAVGADGSAMLVPPGDADALAGALARWTSDPALRRRLKDDARRGRTRLPEWDDTVARISTALRETS